VRHLAVFLSAALLDAVWTLTVRMVADKRAVAAAVYSALTIGLGAFTTISFVSDPRYVVAAVLGGFVGTYLTVRWH